ncbi:MAG: HAD-IA family hydrolase [Clostridia bacterium]|nr:HAD-IA family hydrolase [Clostridia bacterium]
MLEAVIFDMDGVLFDTEQLCLLAWEKVIEKYNLKDIMHICKACIGVSREKSKEIFETSVSKDFPFDEIRSEVSRLCHEMIDESGLPEKTGVREILSFCKEQGLKIGLATSTRRETVMSHLKRANIMDFFDEITCGDEIQSSKPSPEIYITACKKLRVNPENALAVEDSYNGVRSATAAGVKCIMVPDLLPSTEEMFKLSDKVLNNLLAVVEYLKEML